MIKNKVLGSLLRPPRILLVEDSAPDAFLIKRFLHKSRVYHELAVVENGEDAIDYLWQRGPFAKCETPDIVLLDLNLPRMHGLQVLAEIKADDPLKRLPVIILSSSANKADVDRAYSCGANQYWRKPVNLEDTERLVQTLVQSWLEFSLLPGLPVLLNPSYPAD